MRTGFQRPKRPHIGCGRISDVRIASASDFMRSIPVGAFTSQTPSYHAQSRGGAGRSLCSLYSENQSGFRGGSHLPTAATCKVTLTLDRDLVALADAKAAERHTTRNRVLREILAEWRLREREELAREGYEFYADEAREFAEVSSKATAEALSDDSSAW